MADHRIAHLAAPGCRKPEITSQQIAKFPSINMQTDFCFLSPL
jgi:hypothetical protein